MGTTTDLEDPAYIARREADLARFAQRESGNRNITQLSGGPASGPWQIEDSSRGGSGTWEQSAKWAGLPERPGGGYGRAIDYPVDQQHQAAAALYDRRGGQPWAMSDPNRVPNVNARASMPDTSTDTGTGTGLLNISAAGASDEDVARVLRQMNMGSSQGRGDNKDQSFLSRLGAAFGGGGGNLTGADAEQAGLRSMMSMGMGLLANSGYHPIRTTMGEALAAGYQNAQNSMAASQQAGYQVDKDHRQQVLDALGVLNKQQTAGLTAAELRQRTAHDAATEATARGQLGVSQQQANTAAAAEALKAQLAAQEAERLRRLTGGDTPPPAPAPPTAGPAAVAPVAPSATPVAPPTPLPTQQEVVPPVTPPTTSPTLRGPGSTATPPKTAEADTGAPKPADVMMAAVDQAQASRGTQVAGPGAGQEGAPQLPPKGPTMPGSSTPVDVQEFLQGLPPVPRPPHIQAMFDAAGKLDPVQQKQIDDGMHDANLAGDSTAVVKARQDVRNKALEMLQSNQQKARDAEIAYQKDVDAGRRSTHAEMLKADETRLTNREAVTNAVNQKGMEQANTDQLQARNVVQQVQQLRAVSGNVGQPGWLQTTKFPGTDQSIAERLQQAGIPVDDTGGTQLLRGAMTQMTRTLREGMPMGALSDRDLSFIERMGPTEWQDPVTREKAIGLIEQAYKTKQRFSLEVQKQMGRGTSYGDAIDAADKVTKPVVPRMPGNVAAAWGVGTPEAKATRDAWIESIDGSGETVVRLPNGKLRMLKERGKLD